MPHSLVRVWIHAISGTKNFLPLIDTISEERIYTHLSEQLTEINCPVRIINGMSDHVHLLFQLNPKLTIDTILKQVKGNTSHWINHNNVLNDKFAWQTGYGAFSVSQSQLERVTTYIRNQKEHHKKLTFAGEYEAFLRNSGLDATNIGYGNENH